MQAHLPSSCKEAAAGLQTACMPQASAGGGPRRIDPPAGASQAVARSLYSPAAQVLRTHMGSAAHSSGTGRQRPTVTASVAMVAAVRAATIATSRTRPPWCFALARHGRMTLADVLQPAIWTAEHGYPVSELIAHGWRTQVQKLLRSPDWLSGDHENGPPQPSGHELLNDPNLPCNGPGRSFMGTCALTEFSVEVEANGKKQKAKIAKAFADYANPERRLEDNFDDKTKDLSRWFQAITLLDLTPADLWLPK